jgi:hypothetical protein
MRKLLLVFSVLILSLFYYSCQREVSYFKNEDDQISKAKNWFNDYLSQPVSTLFSNVNYHWDRASTFTFKNGYKAVTVPITERKQNAAYRGRRVLYLYPWKNGKGYYATVFELIPSLQHVLNNKGNINLKTFTGYISTWDLRSGFVRGAKFSDGVAETNIQIEAKPSLLTTRNSSSQRTYGSQDLPPVTVTCYLPGPNSGTYWITLTNNLGYSTSYLWDGGSGGNPCEYTGCNYSENPLDYFNESTINHISQELLDKQWLVENVKDSTNNPCASNVINSLSAINDKLPALIRNFFNSDADFSMTIKMDYNSNWGNNGQAPRGGYTVENISSNSFKVCLNNYYSNVTDLGTAATIIHEAFHCQLMNWYREAIVNNDQARREQLAFEYGYLFPPDFNTDSSLNYIVNGGNATQHQDIINRYQNTIAQALYQFALSKGISINLDYCKDLAWTGTFDSYAFNALPYNTQARIRDRV